MPDYRSLKILASYLHFSDLVKLSLCRKELFSECRSSLQLCAELMSGKLIWWSIPCASDVVCEYLKMPSELSRPHHEVVFRMVKQLTEVEMLTSRNSPQARTRWLVINKAQLDHPRGEEFWPLFKRARRFDFASRHITQPPLSKEFIRDFIAKCKQSCEIFEGVEHYAESRDLYTDEDLDMFQDCVYVKLAGQDQVTDAGIRKLKKLKELYIYSCPNVHGQSLKKSLEEGKLRLQWSDMFWDSGVIDLVFEARENSRKYFASSSDKKRCRAICKIVYGSFDKRADDDANNRPEKHLCVNKNL